MNGMTRAVLCSKSWVVEEDQAVACCGEGERLGWLVGLSGALYRPRQTGEKCVFVYECIVSRTEILKCTFVMSE